MSTAAPTFATLRALHALVGDALEEMECVFSRNTSVDIPPQDPFPPHPGPLDVSPTTSSSSSTTSASFPPTPLATTFVHTIDPCRYPLEPALPVVDYPSPDKPYERGSPSEELAAHPRATSAALKIVAACGQISSIVHKPFLTLCDAVMSYNLPACLRLVEHLHVIEILREAEDRRQKKLTQRSERAAASLTKRNPLLARPRKTLLCNDDILMRPPKEGGFQSSNLSLHTGAFTDSASPLQHTRDPDPLGMPSLQEGLHVKDIVLTIEAHSKAGHIDPSNLAHALRLLSTHHFLRETAPDTFALTRVASLLDTGKSVAEVFSCPEKKYTGTDGTAAFVGMTTDELFKSAAYLTEALTGMQLPHHVSVRSDRRAAISAIEGCRGEPQDRRCSSLSSLHSLDITSHGLQSPTNPSPSARYEKPSAGVAAGGSFNSGDPRNRHYSEHGTLPAFNIAFQTRAPFFEWLENGGRDLLGGTGICASTQKDAVLPSANEPGCPAQPPPSGISGLNSFRLERFSKAMTATSGWETPGAIFSGFDWQSLPRGSTIVDVGGGIGSTTMVLARAFSSPNCSGQSGRKTDNPQAPRSTEMNQPESVSPLDGGLRYENAKSQDTNTKRTLYFRFVVQDKPAVTRLGLAAWQSQCPELLDSGQVEFQDHDFFQPQPRLEPPHRSPYPAVYLLRVVLHDWPDNLARRILTNLRLAAGPQTRLIIADHVLPLACAEDGVQGLQKDEDSQWTLDSVLANIEGAERALASPPLLPNLGKASANGYWMDTLMRITFNGKERTLRELCALALSAGWRVTRMTRCDGSLFAHVICEPVPFPQESPGDSRPTTLKETPCIIVTSESQPPTPPPKPYKRHAPPELVARYSPLSFLDLTHSHCGAPTFASGISSSAGEEFRGLKGKRKWLRKGFDLRGAVATRRNRSSDRNQTRLGLHTSHHMATDAAVRAPSPSARVWWKRSHTPANRRDDQGDLVSHQHCLNPANDDAFCDDSDTSVINQPALASSFIEQINQSATQAPEPKTQPTTSARSRTLSLASIPKKLSANFRRPSVPSVPPVPRIAASDAGTPSRLAVNLVQPKAKRILKRLQSLPVIRGRGTEARIAPSTDRHVQGVVDTGSRSIDPVYVTPTDSEYKETSPGAAPCSG